MGEVPLPEDVVKTVTRLYARLLKRERQIDVGGGGE
jgi:hypothetical protein